MISIIKFSLISLALSLSNHPIAFAESGGTNLLSWLSAIPEAQTPAFQKWSLSQHTTMPSKDPFQLQHIPVNCESKELLPTSPYQDTKNYEVHFTGRFDHRKLPARDRLCLVRSRSANPVCLAPDTLHAVIMSDFFVDSCGNVYKGYWSVVYAQREDNMGTLLSKGRTLFPSPRATEQFPEMIEGHIYKVHVDEFLFLTEPTETELRKSTQLREKAIFFNL